LLRPEVKQSELCSSAALFEAKKKIGIFQPTEFVGYAARLNRVPVELGKVDVALSDYGKKRAYAEPLKAQGDTRDEYSKHF
jgi:hypothetical protein